MSWDPDDEPGFDDEIDYDDEPSIEHTDRLDLEHEQDMRAGLPPLATPDGARMVEWRADPANRARENERQRERRAGRYLRPRPPA